MASLTCLMPFVHPQVDTICRLQQGQRHRVSPVFFLLNLHIGLVFTFLVLQGAIQKQNAWIVYLTSHPSWRHHIFLEHDPREHSVIRAQAKSETTCNCTGARQEVLTKSTCHADQHEAKPCHSGYCCLQVRSYAHSCPIHISTLLKSSH